MSPDELVPTELTEKLRDRADAADFESDWPAESWNQLVAAGVTGWCIPTAHGGSERSSLELLAGYEQLAGACLTTTFILSQRDAAVRRIRDSGRADLARELLRPLACGGRFATVGLSQLSTSRQHGAPALTARETSSGFVLDGVMPWVTGADQAEHIVGGAVLPDGRQIMIVVMTDQPGVQIEPPLSLAALSGSRTSEVVCRNAEMPRHWLLAGPAPQVMSTGRGGTGGLETSCLAIGHAGAAIADLQQEAANRPNMEPVAERLTATHESLRTQLHQLATGGGAADAALALRARANALVIRATQAALTASKGGGFVRPHPAQRRARQALFFLVWSCPRSAAEATLRHLADGPICS